MNISETHLFELKTWDVTYTWVLPIHEHLRNTPFWAQNLGCYLYMGVTYTRAITVNSTNGLNILGFWSDTCSFCVVTEWSASCKSSSSWTYFTLPAIVRIPAKWRKITTYLAALVVRECGLPLKTFRLSSDILLLLNNIGQIIHASEEICHFTTMAFAYEWVCEYRQPTRSLPLWWCSFHTA